MLVTATAPVELLRISAEVAEYTSPFFETVKLRFAGTVTENLVIRYEQSSQ
jgi:hypothetical protein